MTAPGPNSLHAARLPRLLGYLGQDPANLPLRAEAFEEALACGEWEQASELLRAGAGYGASGAAWSLRQARLCIARRQLPEAAALLEALGGASGTDPVLAHDLAWVRLLQGDAAAARALLEPWVGPDAEPRELPAEVREPLQLLWLRALHRLQQLGPAWEWAETLRSRQQLTPAACGAASLIAVDRGELAAARALSDAALAVHPQQPEALVARACVALALGEADEATQLLERALQANPQDGRVWSALGLASLRRGRLPVAQQQFERAVANLPEHIGTWHGLGWTRLLQQDLPGAREAFEQALQRDRNFAESHGAVGLVLALQGERSAGLRHLELADRLDPHNVTARYARALLAGQARDARQVQALVARLLDRPGFFGGSLGEAVLRATRAG
jgi:tetratricopeptide (TPR) repeat protein